MKDARARRLLAIATFGFAVAFTCSAAPATDLEHVGGFDHMQTNGPTDYNFNNGDFTIHERFTATRQGSDISADHATGNSTKQMLHAEGNVVVHQVGGIQRSGSQRLTSSGPSTLTCDTLDVDGIRKFYAAKGNVHFTQLSRAASSDVATLDDVTNILHMEGHVHIRDGARTLDSDVLDYNTATGEVQTHGNVTLSAPSQTAAPRTAPPATAAPPHRR